MVVAVATQLSQTADVMHGSRGISQSVVVDVETQELPDAVEIGSTVVMGGVDENVSVGRGGNEVLEDVTTLLDDIIEALDDVAEVLKVTPVIGPVLYPGSVDAGRGS